MRFIYHHDPGKGKKEVNPGSSEKFDALMTDPNSIDFEEFLHGIGSIDPSLRLEWSQKSSALNTGSSHEKSVQDDSGKMIPESAMKLRRGEIDPSKNLHAATVLFSLYMEKTEEKDTFKVNFNQNSDGEDYVGLGEICPQTIFTCTIVKSNGETIEAQRAYDPVRKREAYYEKNSLTGNPPYTYVAVHSGDKVKIVTSLSHEEAEKKMSESREQAKKYLSSINLSEKRSYKIDSTLARFGLRRNLEYSVGGETAGWAEQLPNRGREGIEKSDIPRSERLARIAEATVEKHRGRDYYGPIFKKDPNFETTLQGGKVGCAYVASKALQAAGYLDRNADIKKSFLKVTLVEEKLREQGWTPVEPLPPEGPPPQRGDVVILGKIPPKGEHEHICIALGPDTLYDNNGSDGAEARSGGYGPDIRPLNRTYIGSDDKPHYRPVRAILRPPKEPAATEIVSEQNPVPVSPTDVPSEFMTEKYQRFDGFIDEAIQKAARLYPIPKALVYFVMQQESGGNPNAKSHAGAMGLMQLMPNTAIGLKLKPYEFFDPRRNIECGVRLLASLLNTYNGRLDLALAAYNAGSGNVKKYGNSVPPFKETQQYVRNIAGKYLAFTGQIQEQASESEDVDTVKSASSNIQWEHRKWSFDNKKAAIDFINTLSIPEPPPGYAMMNDSETTKAQGKFARKVLKQNNPLGTSVSSDDEEIIAHTTLHWRPSLGLHTGITLYKKKEA